MDLFFVRNQMIKGKSIFDLPLRAAFYARVSTEKYEQINSLQNQVDYYKEFITKNQNWSFTKGYIDEGISGTSIKNRDSFISMINDAQKGLFDFIITKEISRFSRNTIDSIKYTQDLLRYGVGVLFQSDNINTLMPDSELRLTIMSSIAQEEVRKLAERVKFGFKRSVENGRVLGNSNIWGYKKKDGRLYIDEKEAEIIRLIFNMYAVGQKGIRAISKELSQKGFINSIGNPIGFSTIKNIIKNPKYKGFYCGNKSTIIDYKLKNRKYFNEDEWITYKDEQNVPPIVTEELWEKANSIFKSRSIKLIKENTSYQNKYPYSGKIICAEHNTSYHRTLYKTKNGAKEVWQCKCYKEHGKNGCTAPILYSSEINSILEKSFNGIIKDKHAIINELSYLYSESFREADNEKEKSKITEEIKKIIKLKDNLLVLYQEKRLSGDEFEERNNKFNEEIENHRNKILSLSQYKPPDIDYIKNELSAALNEEDSELLSLLLEKITVKNSDKKDIIYINVLLNNNKEFSLQYERKKSASLCSLQYI